MNENADYTERENLVFPFPQMHSWRSYHTKQLGDGESEKKFAENI
jgi:hypothetical protein